MDQRKCHFTTRYSRMYRINLLFRSATELTTPRVITFTRDLRKPQLNLVQPR